MAFIFHIIDKELWQKEKVSDSDYSPQSLQQEGFIHCAKADQILEILNFMFKSKNHSHLVLLKIFEPEILPEVKTEPPFEFPMSKVHYPHIYGPLNKNAIKEEIAVPSNKDGSYSLPKLS